MNITCNRKLSSNERLILKHFEETNKTFDAETLWLELKAAGHPISICSTYKNVKRLADSGILNKTQVSYRMFIYGLNTPL